MTSKKINPEGRIAISHPDLEYIELRNWSEAHANWYVAEGGNRVGDLRREEPSYPHIDHQKFVEVVLRRIDPETGEIDYGSFKRNSGPPKDLSALSIQQRLRSQESLGNVIFRTAQYIAHETIPDLEGPIDLDYEEGFLADLIAPYRHQPELIRHAAELADLAQSMGIPGVGLTEEWPDYPTWEPAHDVLTQRRVTSSK